MPVRSPAAAIVGTVAGLVIWAVHFLFVYIFAALACARGFQDARLFGIGVVPLAVALATLVALLGVGILLWRGIHGLSSAASAPPDAGQRWHFLHWMTVMAAAYALVAIAWAALPALLLPACR